MPRVSVIIPTYNCERFLPGTIDSALTQSYHDYEVIVVDDGSTDGTEGVVARYDRSVRYFRQANSGASVARNTAISHATGEFLAYLDADDLWDPRKLEQQVAFLDASPACGLVHSDVSVIDEDDRIVHAKFNEHTQRPVPQGRCLETIIRQCHIQTLTVLERRQCFDRAGSFDRRLPIAQDYHHWIGAAVEGFEFGYIPEALGKYRWRQGSLMSNQRRFLADVILIYEWLLTTGRGGKEIGDHIRAVVREELYAKQFHLAYQERVAGEYAQARKRLLHLIRSRPLAASPYVQLLKAYVQQMLA